jgi:hypothetical protein
MVADTPLLQELRCTTLLMELGVSSDVFVPMIGDIPDQQTVDRLQQFLTGYMMDLCQQDESIARRLANQLTSPRNVYDRYYRIPRYVARIIQSRKDSARARSDGESQISLIHKRTNYLTAWHEQQRDRVLNARYHAARKAAAKKARAVLRAGRTKSGPAGATQDETENMYAGIAEMF